MSWWRARTTGCRTRGTGRAPRRFSTYSTRRSVSPNPRRTWCRPDTPHGWRSPASRRSWAADSSRTGTCRETHPGSGEQAGLTAGVRGGLARGARRVRQGGIRRQTGRRRRRRRTQPAMPVEVAVARTDTVVDAILATGQIEAIQSIELRPDIEGRIAEILVREGAYVGAGHAALQGGRRRAQGAGGAGRGRPRSRPAVARPHQGSAGAEGLVPVRAGAGRRHRAEQRGPARAAQGPAGAHHVRAPFAGVVGPAVREPGRLRDDRHPPGRRSRPSRRSGPSFQVPERYADQLKVGQQVTFRVAAIPGQEFTGRVDFVDPVVQLPGRTIMVKAVTPNPKRELQSGMFIEARLATAVRPKAVVIPEDAVRRAPGLDLRVGGASGQGHPPPGGSRRPHAGLRGGAERRRACRAGRGRRPGAAGRRCAGGSQGRGPHSRSPPGELIVRRSAPPILSGLAASVLLMAGSGAATSDEAQTTRAERTDYRETSTYADVLAFLDSLQRAGAGRADRHARHERRGSSGAVGARVAPAGVREPVRSAPRRQAGRLGAGQHPRRRGGGEGSGADAASATSRGARFGRCSTASSCIVVPIYNTDGNEHWAPGEENRPGQNGPAIVGRNQNGQGLNLNRDYVKMEAPETRGAAELLEAWDPDVFIDLHTTNGSYHGYALTYAPGLNPNANPARDYVRDRLLPPVRERMRRAARHARPSGTATFRNQDPDSLAAGLGDVRSRGPRFGTNWMGLRGKHGGAERGLQQRRFPHARHRDLRFRARGAERRGRAARGRARRGRGVPPPHRPTPSPCGRCSALRRSRTWWPRSRAPQARAMVATPGGSAAGVYRTIRMPVFDRFVAVPP